MIRAIAHPTAGLLLAGDVIAIYGSDGEIPPWEGSATLEKPACRDQFTPGGHVTLWTTAGRFDVPDDAPLDLLCWSPMPVGRNHASKGVRS